MAVGRCSVRVKTTGQHWICDWNTCRSNLMVNINQRSSLHCLPRQNPPKTWIDTLNAQDWERANWNSSNSCWLERTIEAKGEWPMLAFDHGVLILFNASTVSQSRTCSKIMIQWSPFWMNIGCWSNMQWHCFNRWQGGCPLKHSFALASMFFIWSTLRCPWHPMSTGLCIRHTSGLLLPFLTLVSWLPFLHLKQRDFFWILSLLIWWKPAAFFFQSILMDFSDLTI